jgi:hypothetical protein
LYGELLSDSDPVLNYAIVWFFPASEHAGVVESIFSNFLPMMVGPFITDIHVVTFALWFFIRIAETIDAHSGYDLGMLSPLHWIPGMLSASGTFLGLLGRLPANSTELCCFRSLF